MDELRQEQADAVVTDAEREQAVQPLLAAAAEGRLTYREVVEGAARAYAARTRGELDPPTRANAARPRSVASSSAKRRWLLALLANERLVGDWTAPERLIAVAVLGDVVVDLRTAFVLRRELSIRATALLGDVILLVPKDARIELSGFSLVGARKLTLEPAGHLLPVPLIRVEAAAVFGDVVVTAQLPSPLRKRVARRLRIGRADNPSDGPG